MNKADYVEVAGNCLLPCFMGGDPKQLKPAVISATDTDEHGYVRHRFVEDGRISAMAFFMASGMPVYRLTQQLRMGRGLFDWPGKEFYPEVSFDYAAHCEVQGPQFKSGRALEDRVRARFPEITPSDPNHLRPLFLHCEGSRVYVDPGTGSKLCKG